MVNKHPADIMKFVTGFSVVVIYQNFVTRLFLSRLVQGRGGRGDGGGRGGSGSGRLYYTQTSDYSLQ